MNSLRRKGGYGDFGVIAKRYASGRRGFPKEVFSLIEKRAGRKGTMILDIGCGTGIATRELRQFGTVVGTDIDLEMLAQAFSGSRDTMYVRAPAEKLPFPDAVFDVVTSFSAFHWFANTQALGEIARVLKPKGYFFVVNKNDRPGGLREKYRILLSKFVNRPLPSAKEKYKPVVLLKKRFSEVRESIVPTQETFTLKEAEAYLASTSVSNLVPRKDISSARQATAKLLRGMAKNGKVTREMNVVVISGRKK